jgi:hypothetical protein
LSLSRIYAEPLDLCSATPAVEGLSHKQGKKQHARRYLDLIIS